MNEQFDTSVPPMPQEALRGSIRSEIRKYLGAGYFHEDHWDDAIKEFSDGDDPTSRRNLQ